MDMSALFKAPSVLLIFGLAGAGKSSVADGLGRALRYRVVHPSSLLEDVCEQRAMNQGKTHAGAGFWETKRGMAFLHARLQGRSAVDRRLDQLLLKEIKKGHVVMDSWTMPWLSKTGVKIFLTAPLAIRAARVAVRSKISVAEATRLIRRRDEETRQLNKKMYGFDIKKDHHVFDLTIDNRALSAKQTQVKIFRFLKQYQKLAR
jgi:cytidylate kinase